MFQENISLILLKRVHRRNDLLKELLHIDFGLSNYMLRMFVGLTQKASVRPVRISWSVKSPPTKNASGEKPGIFVTEEFVPR